MLSGYQCQVVCFALNGELLCEDCATKATSSVTVAKAEDGLANAYDLSAWIRYTLDEYTGQYQWEYAEERVQRFFDEHPGLIETSSDGWLERYDRGFARLVDRYAERHPYVEHCSDCWCELG